MTQSAPPPVCAHCGTSATNISPVPLWRCSPGCPIPAEPTNLAGLALTDAPRDGSQLAESIERLTAYAETHKRAKVDGIGKRGHVCQIPAPDRISGHGDGTELLFSDLVAVLDAVKAEHDRIEKLLHDRIATVTYGGTDPRTGEPANVDQDNGYKQGLADAVGLIRHTGGAL